MTPMLLHHDGRLAVPPPAGPLPAGWQPPAGARVVSFRRPAGLADERGGLNATTRLLDLPDEHLCFYGVETDSPLAPLLLWDAAHALPVGGTITLAGDGGLPPQLGRAYFRDGLTEESRAGDAVSFRKTHELPAERDRGLDRWTFGIPTGPGDATGLNACVQRILELGVPEFEIVLCGRPGPGFQYWEKVRIVGEEYSSPPVRIGLKKNVIAQHARYENLCIIHDRMFLPRDFLAAVRRFGDLYPVVGFQSLWFDDPFNLVAKRYSDYNRVCQSWPLAAQGGEAGVFEGYTDDVFSAYGGPVFVYAHPLRYARGNYLTGSLYLCKRSVWRACPQHPDLLWQQFEDVEFGVRGDARGVPHRLNPFALTQTIFARSGCLHPAVLFERPDGDLQPSVSPLEAVQFRRKPLIKVSWAEAAARRAAFAKKYVPRLAHDGVRELFGPPPGDTYGWARSVVAAVRAAVLPFGVKAARRFVADWQKHLLCDSIDLGSERYALERLAGCNWEARAFLAERSPHLQNILLHRPGRHLFYDHLSEFFPEDTPNLRRGTALTARRLGKHGGAVVYHPDGRPGYEAAVHNSTPYRDYFHEGSA